MRIAYVVQRYGPEAGGGAEMHCREFATRLAGRGHDVEVLTSCARNYTDWANELPAFTEVHDGVVVRRMPVTHTRDPVRFGPLNARVVGGGAAPLYVQEAWMEMQGPLVRDIPAWLREHGDQYDLVVFFTYLYFTTWAGLAAAGGRVPTVLHATGHDEPAFHLPVFDVSLCRPTAFAFSTPEERALVRRRGSTRPGEVIGVGTSTDVAGDAGRFRSTFELGDRPYVIYLGRLDPGKGADELIDFFTVYKARRGGDVALVACGDPVKEFPPHPDIIVTGYVDEQTKHDALAGATALVQPSYFESFSMVLTEAWAFGVPALVQGRCDVLVGQVERSGGGIPYTGYAEFEVALDLLVGSPPVGAALGKRGRRYVEEHYTWGAVIDRYEAFLGRVAAMPPV